MVFHALGKVDVKVMRGPRTLGRKQRRVHGPGLRWLQTQWRGPEFWKNSQVIGPDVMRVAKEGRWPKRRLTEGFSGVCLVRGVMLDG